MYKIKLLLTKNGNTNAIVDVITSLEIVTIKKADIYIYIQILPYVLYIIDIIE